MYSTLRSLLFRLPAETAHDLTLDVLGTAGRVGLVERFNRLPPRLPVKVMGLDFPNPVGLAAGPA